MAEDIVIKAGFEGSQVQRGLDRLRSSARDFGNDLTLRLTGAFAATALLDRGIGMAVRTFEKFADIADKSQRAGISAEDFQRLGYAAELSGTSMEAAAKALREIRNATAQAHEGNKQATESLLKLGFTQEEVRAGNLKSIDVLMRMARLYKAAGTDAERFSIATSVLSARTGSEMMPLLGESDANLNKAMSREVVSNEMAEQFKAMADAAKEATQALELMTANAIGLLMRTSAKVALTFNPAYLGMGAMRSLKEDLADPSLSEKEKERRKKEALATFNDYAQNMRVALTGTMEGGELMTSKRVDEIIDAKFAEFFPPSMQRERWASKQGQGNAVNAAVAVNDPTSPVVAGSLRQIGGGGGVYGGADTMVNLATRTADATERTANAVERLFGDKAPDGEGSVVSDN